MSTVSVIIVSWNAKDFLIDCLRSLEGQASLSDILVVDNASEDGTAEAVCQFDRRITVVRSPTNLGFAAGNNIGIGLSNSSFIALINPDVILKPNCLRRLCAYMDAHPDVGLVGPKVLNPDGTLQHSFWSSPTLYGRLLRALRLDVRAGHKQHLANPRTSDPVERPVDVLSGCFWLVRRVALADVGVLDEDFFMYAEDTDWCKRFWLKRWKVMYVPSAIAVHYGGRSSSRVPVASYVQMHRANLQYWRKYHGRMGQMGVLLIMLLHQAVRIVGAGAVYLTSRSRRESIRPILSRSWACLQYLCGGAPGHKIGTETSQQ